MPCIEGSKQPDVCSWTRLSTHPEKRENLITIDRHKIRRAQSTSLPPTQSIKTPRVLKKREREREKKAQRNRIKKKEREREKTWHSIQFESPSNETRPTHLHAQHTRGEILIKKERVFFPPTRSFFLWFFLESKHTRQQDSLCLLREEIDAKGSP